MVWNYLAVDVQFFGNTKSTYRSLLFNFYSNLINFFRSWWAMEQQRAPFTSKFPEQKHFGPFFLTIVNSTYTYLLMNLSWEKRCQIPSDDNADRTRLGLSDILRLSRWLASDFENELSIVGFIRLIYLFERLWSRDVHTTFWYCKTVILAE